MIEPISYWKDYVKKFGIPFKKVGKLVIATNPDEVTRLKKLFKNAKTNQVPKVRYIDNIDGIREIEPEATGLAAIHSPETGIVDWSQVAKSFSKDIHDAGGFVLCGHRMTDMQDNGDRVDIKTTVSYLDALQKSTPDPFTKIIEAKQVVSCAGTHADRVAQLCGGSREPQIVPVRGEYLVLPADTLLAKRIRGNIYPVPEPDVPFLGVHFTPTMSGDVIIGPNAVLAFSRNGYSNKYRDISVRDLYDMALYGGFWKAALRYGRYGMGEVLKSFYPAIAISNARRYVPALQASQVMHGGRDRCGVRAQAVGSKGDLIDDFVFERAAGGKVVHTRNAPSPGLFKCTLGLFLLLSCVFLFFCFCV